MQLSRSLTNSLFNDNTPGVVTQQAAKRFNREQRRTGTFVIKNISNGKFIKRIKSDDKVTFRDVELDQASIYSFQNCMNVTAEMMIHAGAVRVEICLVWKDKHGLHAH